MAIITLPGLIDLHVHLRTPGQEYKEDFYTGTQAALAGGFTTIIDMPNNKVPITTEERLKEKIRIAKKDTVNNLGFYFGSLGDNLAEFKKVKDRVMGLKLYLNETTGNFLIGKKELADIFVAWHKTNSDKPIMLHAEDDAVAEVIKNVKKTGQKSHFCHISTISDLKQIIKAKEDGLPITCGVTPHHLFLLDTDVKRLGPYGRMKPPLRSKKEVEFLWNNIQYIDVVESDHAPHSKEEKDSDTPPYGVPGLETTLPLLLTTAHEKRITIGDISRLCYWNAANILNIPYDPNTYIEVDTTKKHTISNKNMYSKCGWTPFDGFKATGELTNIVYRGKVALSHGKVKSKRGSGLILSPNL